MSDLLALTFDDDSEPFSGLLVHRVTIRASFGNLYEARMLVLSTDAAVDPHSVNGHAATLTIDGEPYVDRVRGVIRSVHQLTSITHPNGGTASYYEVILAPPMFALGYRKARRIHQHKDAVAIVRDTFAAYLSSLNAPVAKLARDHAPYEYRVQYDESDDEFSFRILADDHITSYFDSKNEWAFTVTDDPATMTAQLPFKLPFIPPSNLTPAGPAAVAMRFQDSVATGAVNLRDYDCEHPQMTRANPPTLVGDAVVPSRLRPFQGEESLKDERYEMGRFTDPTVGNAMATRDLVAARAGARVVHVETNLAIFPGTRFMVEDHPRPDAGEELLVVEAHIHIDDGTVIPLGAVVGSVANRTEPRRSYSLTCVRASQGYVPLRRPKPRAIGHHIAFVVGKFGDGYPDLDKLGRVLIEFPWDHRDQRSGETSMRVFVLQAWAGPNRGLMLPPRIGDRVLVGFDQGDPESPAVVASAHDSVAVPALDLPQKDSPKIILRSHTIGDEGHNELSMNDKRGDELLHLRAQRNRTDVTLGNESSDIGGDLTESIGHDATAKVQGKVTVTVGKDMNVTVGGKLYVESDGKSEYISKADTHIQAAGTVQIDASTIILSAGGNKITIDSGGITLAGHKVDIISA